MKIITKKKCRAVVNMNKINKMPKKLYINQYMYQYIFNNSLKFCKQYLNFTISLLALFLKIITTKINIKLIKQIENKVILFTNNNLKLCLFNCIKINFNYTLFINFINQFLILLQNNYKKN